MRIDQYLQQHLEAESLSDREFESLLSGKLDSTTAAGVWAAIADGSSSVEQTLRWARHVARRVNETVVNGNERDAAPAALKAIGFYGTVDRHRAAREYLDVMASFHIIDEKGARIKAQNMSAKMWLQILRDAGYLRDLKDKNALNRIIEWRVELGIDQPPSNEADDTDKGGVAS